MRLLITGATGFVGGYLARWFAAQGHEVIATGRAPRPADLPVSCRFIRADLSNASLNWPPLDACIHAAGLASDQATWPALLAANVAGTKHLLASLPNGVRLVHISSSSVYMPGREPSRESDASNVEPARLSPYGQSKRLAEQQVMTAASRFASAVILRPRAIYGVGDRVLLPRLLALVHRGWAHVPGDLRVKLSLTHVENLAMATESALKVHTNCVQNTFNVADAEPYELRDVFRTLVEGVKGAPVRIIGWPVAPLRWLADLRLSRQLTPFMLAAVTQDHVLDLGHSRQHLSYVPRRHFAEAAAEVIAWAREKQ